jgi:hypothetical protein
LLVRDYKGKEADRLVTRIDPGAWARWFAELRGHERHAEELEQWKTPVEERLSGLVTPVSRSRRVRA